MTVRIISNRHLIILFCYLKSLYDHYNLKIMNIFTILALLSSTKAINVLDKVLASVTSSSDEKAAAKVATKDNDWNVGGNYTQQLDNNITSTSQSI